jgi:hypothetical protein
MASFHRLVQAQLAIEMDHNRDALGRQGARGALLTITLCLS